MCAVIGLVFGGFAAESAGSLGGSEKCCPAKDHRCGDGEGAVCHGGNGPNKGKFKRCDTACAAEPADPGIPAGHSCEADPTGCQSDLYCGGTLGQRVCKPLAVEGQVCLDANQPLCRPGLQCVGVPGARTCHKPAQQGVLCGQNGRYPTCAAGLFCVGPQIETRCQYAVGQGQRCGNNTTSPPCQSGLWCVGQPLQETCQAPGGQFAACGNFKPPCRTGLSCVNGSCRP